MQSPGEQEAVSHETHLVDGVGGIWSWKCSCGTGGGGRWYPSEQEAFKKADRHVKLEERKRARK